MPAEIESTRQELRVNGSLDAFVVNRDPARRAVTLARSTRPLAASVAASDFYTRVEPIGAALSDNGAFSPALVDMPSQAGMLDDIIPAPSTTRPDIDTDVPSFFIRNNDHPYLQEREALKKEVMDWKRNGDTSDVEYKRKRAEFDGMLTEHEINVLRVSALGLSVKRVAGVFGTNENTIKTQRFDIMRKFAVGSIAPAVIRGVELGIIPEEVLPRDFEYWRYHLLTSREREVYQMLISSLDSYTTEEALAANGQFVRAQTIKNHATQIYQKLGVQGRRGVFLFHVGREMMKRNPDWGKDIVLTSQQKEQLELMAYGHNDKQIRTRLAVEPDEYERNKGLIYDRFRAESRIEAVMHAIEAGEVLPAFPIDLYNVNKLSQREKEAIIKTFSARDQDIPRLLRESLGISDERVAQAYTLSLLKRLGVSNYVQLAVVVACEQGMSSITSTNEKEMSRTLSQREKDVLLEAAKGKSNKEIAASLSLDLKIVVSDLSDIFAKWKVQLREQAVTSAIDEGILKPHDIFADREVHFNARFTRAEAEILACMGMHKGLSNIRAVAEKLGKNHHTVRLQVECIRKKMNVSNFLEVVAAARHLQDYKIVTDVVTTGNTKYSLAGFLQ